ncbi:LacI family DNA-binding transcriptional regulator [Massilia putida]|uniref:LacI family DNA-binding transcriptional regulator n=1 Tax=Massilia putida TaxID=1141883 RepID=UPI000950E552|nr:LacI family DNA-binding transcriptional regulator [Massilia putida]
MQKTSTLTEVAQEAGVSLITASRALRGVGRVAKETRERVLAAAAKLDYTPDMIAQKMRGGNSGLIGVFVNGFRSLVMHELLSALNDEARRLGFDLIVFNADHFDDARRAGTAEMLRKLCDGLLLLLPDSNDGLLDRLERAHAPCVLVSFAGRQIDLPVVLGSNRLAARAAVEHLLGLGHRRIAFIAGTSFTGQSEERQRGYEDALRAAGIAIEPAYQRQGDFNDASGFVETQALLALPHPPTAIFAANDAMAFGALDALSTAGLKVPDDVSVVGFDDVIRAAFVHPKLTTVRQPLNEIAIRAVAELVNAMRTGRADGFRIELPARLVIRDSTGPAHKG